MFGVFKKRFQISTKLALFFLLDFDFFFERRWIVWAFTDTTRWRNRMNGLKQWLSWLLMRG